MGLAEELSYKELARALEGLMAYDEGSTDSGIHDEDLRHRCIEQLHRMGNKRIHRLTEADYFLAVFIKERFLSDEAMRRGYGPEDVASFFRWLANEMTFDIL